MQTPSPSSAQLHPSTTTADPLEVAASFVASPDEAALRAAAAKKRWLALDLLRFLAVLLMIQGHAFYEILGPMVTGQPWYRWHGYVHGFTAPVFLFAAGTAFGITTLRRWEQHTKLGKPVYKRLERYGILIGLGYLLHLGALSLQSLLGMSEERLALVLRIDALQHIGLMLLVIEGLALLLKKKRLFLGVVASLYVLVVAAGPFADAADFSGMPLFFRTWLNRADGSLFPLFPWAGFIFAGILVAAFVQWRKENAEEGWRQLFLPLAGVGTALIVFGDFMVHQSWDPFPEHAFWKVNTWWCLIRLGAVLCVLAAFQAFELLRSRAVGFESGSVLRFIQLIGGQTLVLYVAHLMMIYGNAVTGGLAAHFPKNLNLGESSLVVAGMFVVLFALGWVWHHIKLRYPKPFDRVRYAVTVAIVLTILFN